MRPDEQERVAECKAIGEQLAILNKQRRGLEKHIALGGVMADPAKRAQLDELKKTIWELEAKYRELECVPDDEEEGEFPKQPVSSRVIAIRIVSIVVFIGAILGLLYLVAGPLTSDTILAFTWLIALLSMVALVGILGVLSPESAARLFGPFLRSRNKGDE